MNVTTNYSLGAVSVTTNNANLPPYVKYSGQSLGAKTVQFVHFCCHRKWIYAKHVSKLSSPLEIKNVEGYEYQIMFLDLENLLF